MTVSESTYDDVARIAELSSGQSIHGFHKSTSCKGEVCPVHKPSNHAYRNRALQFNWQVFAFERIVPETEEGFVPDPDDYLLNKRGFLIYKNSVRCNHCGEEIESSHKFESQSCECRKITIRGGSAYQEITGRPEDYTDTSVLYEDGTFTGKVV